jgi:hypothetical protein
MHYKEETVKAPTTPPEQKKSPNQYPRKPSNSASEVTGWMESFPKS